MVHGDAGVLLRIRAEVGSWDSNPGRRAPGLLLFLCLLLFIVVTTLNIKSVHSPNFYVCVVVDSKYNVGREVSRVYSSFFAEPS